MTSCKCNDQIDFFGTNSQNLRSVYSSGVPAKLIEELIDLPQLHNVPSEERDVLFIQKLHQCGVIFDFMDPRADLREKEVKRSTLLELIGYVKTGKRALTPAVYPEIIRMVSSNLFRDFPPTNDTQDFDLEMKDVVLDASWPHLTLVYEFFQTFLESPEFQLFEGKKVIDQKFVVQLLQLFDSEDPNKRNALKNVLHRVYSKFMGLRAFIREQINNIFLTFIYETQNFNGIGEILEILSSIINGFSLPLKKEHLQFLMKILLPLHTCRSFLLYHSQLTCCVLQFLEKDPNLTERVIRRLLRYWPKTSSQKEVQYLFEVEEILLVMDASQVVKIQEALVKQLAQCVSSPHAQVAEKAISFWNNEAIGNLIEMNNPDVMAIMLPALCRTSKDHWNSNIIVLVNNVIKTFARIGPSLLEDLLAYFEADRQKDLKMEGRMEKPLKKELNVYENIRSKQWPTPMINRLDRQPQRHSC